MGFRTASRVQDRIQRADFVQMVMWCGLLYFTYTQRRKYLSTTVMYKLHLAKIFENEDTFYEENQRNVNPESTNRDKKIPKMLSFAVLALCQHDVESSGSIKLPAIFTRNSEAGLLQSDQK